MDRPYFTERAGELLPQASAGSSWGASHMRGLAVSGALARAAENVIAGRPDLVPVRWTVDLFAPARMEPSTVTACVVRESKRLCLVDAVFCQAGEPVSRASGLFLRPSENPAGHVWNRADVVAPPDPRIEPESERLYFSGSEWTADVVDHVNGNRKALWHFPVPVVDGERPTPFQTAATVADVASLAANFGTGGLEYINPDFTLALARLPTGPQVGLLATSRIEHHGITIATVAMFDRAGTFATITVSGLANSHKAIRNPIPSD